MTRVRPYHVRLCKSRVFMKFLKDQLTEAYTHRMQEQKTAKFQKTKVGSSPQNLKLRTRLSLPDIYCVRNCSRFKFGANLQQISLRQSVYTTEAARRVVLSRMPQFCNENRKIFSQFFADDSRLIRQVQLRVARQELDELSRSTRVVAVEPLDPSARQLTGCARQ